MPELIEGQYVWHDVLFAGDPAALQDVASHLGISGERVVESGSEADHETGLQRGRRLVWEPVRGDFQLALGFEAFDMRVVEWEQALLDLTQGGRMAFALPDDDSDRPFDYVLFHEGERLRVELDEDEDLDEVRLLTKTAPSA
jgi:hypothetical protein